MESCRARLLVQFPTALQVFLRHQVKLSEYIILSFVIHVHD